MTRDRTLSDELIRQALLTGPANGAEVAQRLLRSGLEVSQPTLSRRLAELAARGEILQLGEKRGRCNYLQRPLEGTTAWPLYQVMSDGTSTRIGHLYRVYPGFAWQVGALSGHSENFPWWLMDILPQGYLGRTLAGQQGLVSTDAGIWSEDQTLQHLSRLDLAGDLLIGEASYLAFIQQPHGAEQATLNDLSSIAAQLSLQAIGGSSAGGEQPKFVRAIAPYGDCIIKFSSDITQSANARRWADLLLAEQCALQMLAQNGIPTPDSQLIIDEQRAYLLSPRFDRLPQAGRCGVVSLRSLNAEFLGKAETTPWPELCRELARLGIIQPQALPLIERVWTFGVLIANQDMHPGNLSFLRTSRFEAKFPPAAPLQLAPVYDMLPMAYAPARAGDRRQADSLAKVQLTPLIGKAVWLQTYQLAQNFWQQLSQDSRLSDEFRAIASASQLYLQQQILPALQRMAE
jgi:hypothetical protein